MNYNNVDPKIKKLASEIVFSAATIDGAPYTVCLEVGESEVFVNVEAYMNTNGVTRYLVEVSPDGYDIVRKKFRDTPPAVRFLATRLAIVAGQGR